MVVTGARRSLHKDIHMHTAKHPQESKDPGRNEKESVHDLGRVSRGARLWKAGHVVDATCTNLMHPRTKRKASVAELLEKRRETEELRRKDHKQLPWSFPPLCPVCWCNQTWAPGSCSGSPLLKGRLSGQFSVQHQWPKPEAPRGPSAL